MSKKGPLYCNRLTKSIFNVVNPRHPQVEYEIVDLASFSAVQIFAEEYKSKHTKLDILVNNAGVVRPPINATEQGEEAFFLS